ncbi:uncharacterized protein LOC141821473 [Curcuma longa]|uniref:uncharacterized protein LOC141821473 n=1 Tax=Curcuma longa TaxID=136217 RepID=UPI003D9EBE86
MDNCSNDGSSTATNTTDDLPAHDQQILLETFTCAIALFLTLTFLIAACQNRLWHKNRFIHFLLKIMDEPLVYLLNQSLYLVLVFPFRNDLYFLWAVLLLIGFESAGCISGYSLSNPQTAKTMYSMFFVNNLIVGLFIGFFSNGSKFRVHLWVLWTLITLKMAERWLSFVSARRAYGTNMVDVVSDYMQYEHTLSSPDEVDAATLQGYKYLVHGEAAAKFNISGDYQVRIDVENQRLVTVDKIWRCKTGLLSPGSDRLKDLCLSFALFKLLRRSFARSPVAESERPKTRDLVFRGILAEDDDGDRAFAVVKAELGFLRDIVHTKYPIIFGGGFPTANFIICVSVLGVMGWLSKVVYHDYHHPPPDEMVNYVGKHNVDLNITYLLLGMILAMEVIEFLTYLFSDWAKVMLVCGHVQGSWLLKHVSLSKMLRFICTPTFSQALCSDIGQHSLLDASRSSCVKLPPEVKTAIATSLRESRGNLSTGGSSLQRNGVSEALGWACKLPTLLHTIMVWHIATHYCELMKGDPSEKSSAPTEEMLRRNKLTANALSKYCAHLLVSAPDLLPISARHDAKLVHKKIVRETRKFMGGAKTRRDKYGRMNQQVGGDRREETVIEMGSRLGRQLGSISLYERWKVLAELWAELLLYLAPTDNPNAHLKKLEDGGEFITQVWILLFHAGILKQPLMATTNINDV